MKELFAALSKAQAEMKGALKDSKNPFFHSKYADLESCWAACRNALTNNGLCIIQTMDYSDGNDFLITTIGHSSGESWSSKLRVVATKQDPQAMGSAITYSRRYGLAAIIGLVQTDDDGETAMGRDLKTPPESPTSEDGNLDPLVYKITFGKFAQRTLEEVGPDELRSYVRYLENKAKKDGKEIIGKVKEFIDMASEYIGSFENKLSDPSDFS